ncbi:endoribonuclease YbeY isoform X2 [Ambystoma mexicanum]|uniref:endoribonuclease YbeY isoform X2 n=1 Tax=Ambystoma mexicanum TaxID=8296 RepID=UPI0037E7E260
MHGSGRNRKRSLVLAQNVFAEMSLLLHNLQKVIPLRRIPLRQKVEMLRHILGVQRFDLGLICVDDRRMQRINQTYRGKDLPTDVLSFPFKENLKAGEMPQPAFRDDYNLGDIFLGVEYIHRQCLEQQEEFYAVLTVVAAHGLCHLLGYTHNSASELEKMYHKEKLILGELNRLTGSNLNPLTKNQFQ